jgi:hypothetical protein
MIRRTALLAITLAACTTPPPTGPASVASTGVASTGVAATSVAATSVQTTSVTAPVAPAAAVIPPAPVCRAGPNGAPVTTDRGIGGTGLLAGTFRFADRGIGGTGIGNEIPRSVVRGFADRPMPLGHMSLEQVAEHTGGIGVTGVITGFSSVCIDGREILLDGAVPIDVDGASARGTALRAGQFAIIDAARDDAGIRALHLSVRHEVIGPIERRDPDGNGLTVAGQHVRITSSTWDGTSFGPGDWIAVSGLRAWDGDIVATRLDAAAKGTVIVHGRLESEHGRLHIGALALTPASHPPGPGSLVTAEGTFAEGVLHALKVEGDRLAEDPAAFFGPVARRLIIHAIGRIDADRLWLSPAMSVPVTGEAAPASGEPVDAVFVLRRGDDGSYTASREETPTRNAAGTAAAPPPPAPAAH